MARPKLGDSESKRLQMVITEDELKAIEDWQFENRVPSKSEAIRRLVQIGLRMERQVEKMIEDELEVTVSLERALGNIKNRVRKAKTDDEGYDALVEIVRVAIRDLDKALIRQMESTDNFFYMISEIAPFVDTEKFADLGKAIESANVTRKEVEDGQTALKKIMAHQAAKEGKE